MSYIGACDLKSCFLCRLSLPDWIPAIAASKKNITLKKGQALFKEGEAVTGIYFVYSGVIKVSKRWDKEKDIILRFAKTGDIVGHLGLGTSPIYPVSTTAVETAVVCYVDLQFFDSTLNINNALVRKLMEFFANELQEAEVRVRNQAHMSVKARIARAVILLKEQFGSSDEGTLNIQLTRQELSAFSANVYESTFRVINELTDKGYVNFSGKDFRILNEKALRELVLAEEA